MQGYLPSSPRRRIDKYWEPYHAALQTELDRLCGRHGSVVLQKQAARFLGVLAGVQTRHKAKRNLMQRLERVAGEARKQGAGG